MPAAFPGTAEEPEKSGGLNPTDEVLLNVIRPDYERPAPPPPVEPLYDLDDAGNVRGKRFFLRLKNTKKGRKILKKGRNTKE